MLLIGIGTLFIIGGIVGIFFASKLKPHLLMKPTQRDPNDTDSDPFRGGGVKLEEFIKENYARRVLNYVAILLILVGCGFIYKSITLQVPADKVAVRYVVTGDFNTPPDMYAAFGPGWHFVSPFRTYILRDISKVYNMMPAKMLTRQERIEKMHCHSNKIERDNCLAKLAVWEKACGKPDYND